MTRRLPIAVVTLLLLGCTEPEPKPEPEPDLVENDPLKWEDMKPAITKVLSRIADLQAKGWPDETTLGADERPLVKVPKIQNRLPDRIDRELLTNELINAITKQGFLTLTAGEPLAPDDDLGVNDERDFGDEGAGSKKRPPAPEASLVLQGVISADGADCRFELTLHHVLAKEELGKASITVARRRKKAAPGPK